MLDQPNSSYTMKITAWSEGLCITSRTLEEQWAGFLLSIPLRRHTCAVARITIPQLQVLFGGPDDGG